MLKNIITLLALCNFLFSSDLNVQKIDYTNYTQVYENLSKEDFAAYAAIKNQADIQRHSRLLVSGALGAGAVYALLGTLVLFSPTLNERIDRQLKEYKNSISWVPRILPQAHNDISYGLAMAMRF